MSLSRHIFYLFVSFKLKFKICVVNVMYTAYMLSWNSILIALAAVVTDGGNGMGYSSNENGNSKTEWQQ